MCYLQFADLRLPPGITLTRVDPAKQHTVLKPNIVSVHSIFHSFVHIYGLLEFIQNFILVICSL